MACILSLSRSDDGPAGGAGHGKRNFAMTLRSFERAFDALVAVAFVSLSLLVAGATAVVGA